MLKQQIIKEHLIFVDLDGTLVATDKANNLAYQQAVSEVLGSSLSTDSERITAEKIEELLGERNEIFNRVIQRKKILYPNFLSQTWVNKPLLQYLKKAILVYPIYLITNSEKNRANETLVFHSVLAMFTDIFYCKSIENKYQYVIEQLDVNPHNILVFENDMNEINKAISVNILQNNIYHIHHWS